MLAFFFAALLATQQVPVPQPFPRPGTPPPAAPAAPGRIAPPVTPPPATTTSAPAS